MSYEVFARKYRPQTFDDLVGQAHVSRTLKNAVAQNRDIMGATNPANAAPGTIRKDFAESIEANSVHGSDSPENAVQEIAFFFSAIEICP